MDVAVDDTDSVYSADTAAPSTRNMDEPFGIVLAGSAGKLVDEAFDVIEAEEMSSNEDEAASASSVSAHTEALTDAEDESLDPISDDDALHMRSVRISDDAPVHPRVTPHASLITPSSSDSPIDLAAPKNSGSPRHSPADVSMTSPPRADNGSKVLVDDDDRFYGVDARLADDAIDDEEDLPSPTLLIPRSRNKQDSERNTLLRLDSTLSATAPIIGSKRDSDMKTIDTPVKKSSGGGGLFSTFYRAFKKPSKPNKEKQKEKERIKQEESEAQADKDDEADNDSEFKSVLGSFKENDRALSARSASSSTPRNSQSYAELQTEPIDERLPAEVAEEERHLRLEQTLKSQIATLRSARSGFVDLALLTPMTEKTLAAVEGEATRILVELPEVERRKEEVARKVEILEMSTEAELAAKEQLLVVAKMKLVEARCDLQTLKHELLNLRKTMAQPKHAATAERMRIRSRREKAMKELRAAVESRDTMLHNLETRQGALKRIRSEVGRLEKSVKDLEGEWE